MFFKKVKKADLEAVSSRNADQERQENKMMRAWISFGVVIILLILLFFASINIGSLKVGFGELLSGLFVKYNKDVATIYDLRFPRIIISMLAGAAIAVSGVLFQAVLKNPLADPGIIGISSGASFTAVIITAFAPTLYFFTPIGTLVTDWTNDTFVAEMIQPAAQSFLEGIGASAAIQDLIVNGIIGGLGAILGFVPQMAILFLFLSILEDCGYMVRIAFVMDRVFRHFGLSGKSFIPLLISSGCGIPGIMASKTIEQDNDRRLTIMTATFIPCGAKLPVIAMMGGVMTSYATGSYEAGGLMAPCMYFIGIVAVLVAAIILKKTKPFSGKPAPFVMELPQYHIPSAKTVLLHVWERLKGFIIKAGTILFLACVVMWFLSGYGFVNGSFGAVEDPGNSLLAVIGGAIAPIFAPLGFDNWKAVAASLSGFSAKESIVSTMGVLANVTGDASEDAVTVAEAVRTWFPSAVAAFSFLLFNLLDSPCLAAISTMAKEMQSRKWFWFAILFQNIFAYVVTLIVYQIGTFATGGAFTVGTAVGIVLLLVMLFLLFRPDPYKDQKVYSKRSVQA